MAAFENTTQTAPGWDPFAVRVTVTSGGGATGSSPDVIVVYARRYVEEYERFAPLFSERALNALEARQLRLRAAFEMRVVEGRQRRLAPLPRPALPAHRVARCCSLAGAWRVRH
jgi:hypothetical protein